MAITSYNYKGGGGSPAPAKPPRAGGSNSLLVPGLRPATESGGPQVTPRNPDNQVNIRQPDNPNQLSDRQTQGNYNYSQAMAHSQGDPRYSGKEFQRAGLSSSKGTAGLAAGGAASRSSQFLAEAESGRMADGFNNANLRLDDQAQQSQYGSALAGLQEDARLRNYMNQMKTHQNFFDNAGSMMSPFGGGGSSMLKGLL